MQKIILITGATDGIGLETAKMLAQQGHHILIHGRNPAKINKVVAALSRLSKTAVIESYVADLSTLPEVEALATQIMAGHQRLDVLINNAGVYKVSDITTSDNLDVRFVVNTIAPYLLTQKLLPLFNTHSRIDALLEGVEVQTGVNYFDNKDAYNQLADKVLYTGKIDEFFDCQFGALEYRSLHFETEVLDEENYQGNAVVNYTERDVPYTRILEHKHFEFGNQEKTVVTKEYPHEFSKDNEPYYPINDETNNALLARYQELALTAPYADKFIFGGRLANYKYYDMDDTIEAALALTSKELS